MNRPTFTIRGVLLLTVLIALALGWYRSIQRSNAELADLAAQLAMARNRLSFAKNKRTNDAARIEYQQRKSASPRGVLSGVRLEGADLIGAVIEAGDSSFYKTSFIRCNLRDASLRGATSSFQGACFDGATLINATLIGGGSSFQYASFVGADLTGATLRGGGASFQLISFENAKLIDATLSMSGTSLQSTNINGAQFQGANLSTIEPGALASCYFDTPPTYNARTKFPRGFSPKQAGWQAVE